MGDMKDTFNSMRQQELTNQTETDENTPDSSGVSEAETVTWAESETEAGSESEEVFDDEETRYDYVRCLGMPRITHEDLEEAWSRLGRSDDSKDRDELMQIARRHIAYEIRDFCQDGQWDPEAMFDGFSDYQIHEFLEIYPPVHWFFKEALRRQISDRIWSEHVEITKGKWITETKYDRIRVMINKAVSEAVAGQENTGIAKAEAARMIKKICDETGEDEEKVSVIYQDVMEERDHKECGCRIQWMMERWPLEHMKEVIMNMSDTRIEIIFSLHREGRPGTDAFRRVAKEYGFSPKHVKDIYNGFIRDLNRTEHPVRSGSILKKLLT